MAEFHGRPLCLTRLRLPRTNDAWNALVIDPELRPDNLGARVEALTKETPTNQATVLP